MMVDRLHKKRYHIETISTAMSSLTPSKPAGCCGDGIGSLVDFPSDCPRISAVAGEPVIVSVG